ncbi:hypothetical protein AAVH_01426 [Aphelenchoides avenae]|nr:hypothetical protein AAVH_01426 [Aphelenchus avenae]
METQSSGLASGSVSGKTSTNAGATEGTGSTGISTSDDDDDDGFDDGYGFFTGVFDGYCFFTGVFDGYCFFTGVFDGNGFLSGVFDGYGVFTGVFDGYGFFEDHGFCICAHDHHRNNFIDNSTTNDRSRKVNLHSSVLCSCGFNASLNHRQNVNVAGTCYGVHHLGAPIQFGNVIADNRYCNITHVFH